MWLQDIFCHICKMHIATYLMNTYMKLCITSENNMNYVCKLQQHVCTYIRTCAYMHKHFTYYIIKMPM